MSDEVTQLKAAVHYLRQALQSIEWREREEPQCAEQYCRLCDQAKSNGHSPDCWVGMALSNSTVQAVADQISADKRIADKAREWERARKAIATLLGDGTGDADQLLTQFQDSVDALTAAVESESPALERFASTERGELGE